MAEINIIPVGMVSSPFKERGDAPRQGRLSDELSKITIFPEYLDALLGLSEGADIFILCWFDRSDRSVLQSHLGGDETRPIRGVFASRSPNRPNPISLTLARLVKIEGNKLTVKGLEALDRTPVLDIKPYSEQFDTPIKE
ncbi:MAG: tRNA (N6-threonylcarbamoyladenosine(37)-N6)-methyltransferase TrmO [Methanomicrobium sp.]|nr:tRNA (N6-threonylcarbamoyladenosine(37)-N6)-methyltransferase TrmO [Methanomicrobium sp.]MBQ4415948.1 tRNA (N6-threonylcarbamoyladenosine(37)-N6)-methyltransferase TrmO [Methanomicrobium sp.]